MNVHTYTVALYNVQYVPSAVDESHKDRASDRVSWYFDTSSSLLQLAFERR